MVIFFWFVLEVSLEVAGQVLSTLIYSLGLKASGSLGTLVGCLMLVGIFVHNKWAVMVALYRILSVFKFVNSFVNLNISYSLILIWVTAIPARNSSLRITGSTRLPHSLEDVVLGVGLSSRRLPRDVSHLEVSTWLWAIPSPSEGLFSAIPVRGLIWIFGCGDSLLNLVREFLVNDHRVMKTHVTLLHAFRVSFKPA